ncbi:hypothetical protein PIB30_038472 [Stylosanthes scabra]|uniref:PiggyBac transposable element-derived protein domain-containing protein n=1 Tax=Stylosanthes scabra TaxID=79078 RepID=A0ABU6ZBF3_9FABA|nr:hypothetical protein [Stylosanthes scabra]
MASSKPKAPKTKPNPSRLTPKVSLSIIHNEHDTIIEDPDDRTNPNSLLFPFAVEDKTYCFLSPLLPQDKEKSIESFFPSAENRELLLEKDIYTHNFLKGKSFRNDPKTSFRSVNIFRNWFDRVAPSYVEFWKSHKFYDLM